VVEGATRACCTEPHAIPRGVGQCGRPAVERQGAYTPKRNRPPVAARIDLSIDMRVQRAGGRSDGQSGAAHQPSIAHRRTSSPIASTRDSIPTPLRAASRPRRSTPAERYRTSPSSTRARGATRPRDRQAIIRDGRFELRCHDPEQTCSVPPLQLPGRGNGSAPEAQAVTVPFAMRHALIAVLRVPISTRSREARHRSMHDFMRYSVLGSHRNRTFPGETPGVCTPPTGNATPTSGRRAGLVSAKPSALGIGQGYMMATTHGNRPWPYRAIASARVRSTSQDGIGRAGRRKDGASHRAVQA